MNPSSAPHTPIRKAVKPARITSRAGVGHAFAAALGLAFGALPLSVHAGDEAKKAAAAADPVALIRAKDTELQKLLREKKTEGHRDRLKQLINGIFDFAELGKRALGRNAWDEATEKQRAEFVQAFQAMVENSSLKKLDAYRSDSTRYDPAEGDEDRMEVTAHVWNKGSESIVVYKLRATEGSWKAWDLVIDDLSTARNYNEQFRKILEKHGLDELIARLEKKAAQDADPAAKQADNVKAAGAVK